jgi:large-conductance mechanosensitive channel
MMVLTKIKDFIMNDNVLTVSIALVILTMIGAVTFYQYSELKSLERNVESAIVKGIDPVAVRCAYAKQTDTICIAYGTAVRPK